MYIYPNIFTLSNIQTVHTHLNRSITDLEVSFNDYNDMNDLEYKKILHGKWGKKWQIY